MKEIFKKCATCAFAITSALFTFVPESFFRIVRWIPAQSAQKKMIERGITEIEIDIIISRLLCFAAIWVVTAIGYCIYKAMRRSVKIKGDNYTIEIKYGDIFKEKNCKTVINFDECYTTKIGNKPCEIKAGSICGQYLQGEGKNTNIRELISCSQIQPEKRRSRFQNRISYKPGSIVLDRNNLLLAFATLDENGRARFFTLDEYIDCLSTMWKQIELNCEQQDVCVPILGAGLTKFEGGNGASLSQQQLLELMVWSYRLSPHKIKSPYKLRIVCKKCEGFSLNNIEGL